MLEITPENNPKEHSHKIAQQILTLKEIHKDTEADHSQSDFFRLNQMLLTNDLNCKEIYESMNIYFGELEVLNDTDKKLLKMMLFNFWVPPQDFPDFEFEYCESKFYKSELIKVANYKKLKDQNSITIKNSLEFHSSLQEILDYYEIYKTQQNISTPENSFKISLDSDEFYFFSSFGLVKFFDASKLLDSRFTEGLLDKNKRFRDFLNEINRDFVLMQNQNNKELIAQFLKGSVKFEFMSNSELNRHSNDIFRISLSSYTPKSSMDISRKSRETIYLSSSGAFVDKEEKSNLCNSCLAFFGCIWALEIDNIKRDDCSLHPKNIVATTVFQSPINSQTNSSRRDLEMY